MNSQALIVLVGVVLAGWGHLMLHDKLGAETAWRWIDDRFPVVLRSESDMAAPALLLVGALTAALGMLGAGGA